jgi:carboxymethylenebutenolidase
MCFQLDARPPELPDDLPRIRGGAGAETLVLTSSDGTEFAAALAASPEPRGPAVIVLPDVRGLYRFYIELAERVAEAGHHAIAFDYFGRTAGARERGDDFDFMSHVPKTTAENVQLDIAASRSALAERTDAESFVTLGFCFGGTHSFFAGTNPDLGLNGVIGFYGLLNPHRVGKAERPSLIEHGREIRGPVLGLFGGADESIPAEDVEAFDSALESAGVPHELITYPGAPHSFFDRGFDEHAEASADAWRRVLDFLDRLPVAAA